jgi:ABC-type antimicrobial peptide transport system permease subunit
MRAEHAQVELAVRGALGSGVRGLMAQSLGESVVVSALGGALGVLMAFVGV